MKSVHSKARMPFTFGIFRAMTRDDAVMRESALPGPTGTTTTTFHVYDGTYATPLGMVAVVKPLGPATMRSSLPSAAMLRHSFSNASHGPWLFSEACGTMFVM